MHIGLHVKYRLFLSDFNENLIFSTDFRKILKCKIPRKSVQWELICSMQVDRPTRRRLLIAFGNFLIHLKLSIQLELFLNLNNGTLYVQYL